MDKVVTIKNGDFAATLDLEAIDKLTLDQWRKLVRLAADNLWDNAQAVNTMINALKETIYEADQAWKKASHDYVDGFRDVSFIRDEKPKRAAKTNNRKLTEAVKSAKHKKELWEKRLDAITDRIPIDQLNYCLRAQQ